MNDANDNDEPTPGKYDEFAIDMAYALDAEFSILWVEGGKRGNGMCVQHSYEPNERVAKMRRIAKAFDCMAEWARREAGDVNLH